MDEEQKLDDGAELLRASAFLARCVSFRYIKTRSEMKMSDEQPAFASGLPGAISAKACEQDSKLALQLNNMDRASQTISSSQMRRPECAISKIKSPNSVSRTYSNPLKTHAPDTLKSPKNQKSDPGLFDRFPSRATAILISFPAFLTETAPQTEIAVTCTKQTTARVLTETGIDHPETRVRAKMMVQMNARMSGIR